MKLRNRTAALLAIPALTLALAACSDDDATDGNATTTTTEAPTGQSAAVVQVAGADVDGDFTPVRCTLDGDELDIEIGGDDDGAGHVDIDIKDPNGTPVLDSLDIDSANIDIEIDDDNADNAVVNRDGDTWTITGTGKYDDEDRTDEVRVEVVCPV